MNKEFLDSVFHAYDIRGLVDEQLNEEFFYKLGKAFVTFTNAKNIYIGYDIRSESKVFSDKFVEGATELGCEVKIIGEIPTEMIYFAVGSDENCDGGVVITASHNPAGWNGCKLVGKNVKPFSSSFGLPELKNLLANESYNESTSQKGEIRNIDLYPAFKNKVLSFLEGTSIKPMNIIVDAGNGIGGKVFEYIFRDLGLNFVKMYFEPDGTFPNHVPDPLKNENVEEIKNSVVELGADLGVAIDGDADRVAFIDSTGRNPSGIFTGSIFAKKLCESIANAKIIHDPRVIWPITKEVVKVGGIPILNKAGHSFFKERMRSENADLGVELSSHFFYKDFFYSDSGMISIALMLRYITEGLNFKNELDYLYSKYFVSGEVNFKVENKDEIIENVKRKFSDGDLNEIDGISIEYPDWRFNLRKSNTQSYLRLNIEATSEEILIEKFDDLEKLIGVKSENSPVLVK